MGDFGAPPVVPPEFQLYNSYEEDPKWQRTFTAIWCSGLAASVAFSLPYLVKSIRNRRAFAGLTGVGESNYGYIVAPDDDDLDAKCTGSDKDSKLRSTGVQRPGSRRRSRLQARLEGMLSMMFSSLLWSVPGFGVNVGQILLLVGYAVALVVCIVKDSVLVENSNRAGFIAVAQLPIVFLFATKNSVLSFLLGPGHGYEKLNYIHRWSGRAMLIAAIVHGSLWIQNHVVFGLPILGPQKETSGVATLGVLCILVLTALRPVRRWCYEVFFYIHILSFVAFFVTVCYHTIYAPPWIFPPLAFYGFDMLLRLFKYRIKDATLTAVDRQMTLIRIPYCDVGWEAGQHIRLRVFFSGRILESHPFSIINAPPGTSCLRSGKTPSGILLGARVVGDWTKALNQYAISERERELKFLKAQTGHEKEEEDCDVPEADVPLVPVHVMIDGPYGGSSIDLGEYESVLLVAGGSGATFTLGLLDDIVGRCIRLNRRGGERTRRIEFAWCIKSFGSLHWFATMLGDIAKVVHCRGHDEESEQAGLDLHISVYVTCLCSPEEVPDIPNMNVTIDERPSVKELLRMLVTPPEVETAAAAGSSVKLPWVELGGGVGVCASGPESLTREAANAVASLGLTRGVELGGIAVHTEVFSL